MLPAFTLKSPPRFGADSLAPVKVLFVEDWLFPLLMVFDVGKFEALEEELSVGLDSIKVL